MDSRQNKIHLTNESVNKKFKSNFELVNYAIKLAENMIKTGRDARVKSDIQNRAMLVLEEINEGKDRFDEVTEKPAVSVESVNSRSEAVYEEKGHERRRNRALFSVEDDE